MKLKRYVCSECGAPCSLTVPDDADEPGVCPFIDEDEGQAHTCQWTLGKDRRAKGGD